MLEGCRVRMLQKRLLHLLHVELVDFPCVQGVQPLWSGNSFPYFVVFLLLLLLKGSAVQENETKCEQGLQEGSRENALQDSNVSHFWEN